MNGRLGVWLPLLLLLALAALTFWLDLKVQPPLQREPSKRHDPDYIVDNFSATRMGPDGVPMHRLSAKRMTHFPDDDSTELEAPNFVRFEPGKAPLSITSAHAHVSSNGDQVKFKDDVRLVRGAHGDRSEMVLTTSSLLVIPDKDFAETQSSVTIVDANTKITAVGLEFDNRAQTVKLLSSVKGTYVKRK